MAFIVQCDNKNCLQMQAAKLDLLSNKVICAECGNCINNITIFAKSQLKFLGQTTKNVKNKQTYSIKCQHCSIENVPIIIDDIFKCSSCKKELTNISMPFKLLLKDKLYGKE